MKDFFKTNQTFLLALLTLGSCFIIISTVLFASSDKDIKMFILGALITTISSVTSYYFGSSTGSKEKQKLIDDLSKNDPKNETTTL